MKITRQRSTGRALTPFAGFLLAAVISIGAWYELVSLWVS